MKRIALSLIAVASLATAAFAANPNFETHKSKVLNRIDGRVGRAEKQKVNYKTSFTNNKWRGNSVFSYPSLWFNHTQMQ